MVIDYVKIFAMKHSSYAYVALLLLCWHTATPQGRAQHQRPNIIFVYTDDQADWTTGVSGNKQSHTPNIDRLAHEGLYFKNAFVTTPVCSPARASLMTSQYASEYGILDFIPQPGHKLFDPDKPLGLDTASVTFAEVLQKAGYATGLIGKWHLGDWLETADKRFHPTNNGFDYFMGITGGGTSPDNPLLEKDGNVQRFQGLTVDILTGEALDFIDRNQENPFLLCLNYRSPHGAWLPVAPEDWAPYEQLDIEVPDPDYPDLDIPKVKKRMKEYLASVSGVDRSVGKLLAKLEAAGLDENTVIIFTSDHGYNMGHNGIEHKGNGIWITKTRHPATENLAANSRPNLYDNSLRVPALVRWPAKIQPGKVVTETISSLDWYPTIVALAGGELPRSQPIRGRDLQPFLLGKKVRKWDNDVYAEYSMINYSRAYMRAYRTPEWKLVKDFLDPSRDELYHLAVDPDEHHNLVGETGKEANKMKAVLTKKILRQMAELNDPLRQTINSRY